MAKLGPDSSELRKTPLCSPEPSIIDEDTVDEIRNIYKDIHHEIAGDVLFRKFNPATAPQGPYAESTQKLFLPDIALKGIFNPGPNPQELMSHGITEEVDAIVQIAAVDLEDPTIVITTDDRMVFNGVVYNVNHVNPEDFLQNKPTRFTIALKIFSRQAPTTAI